MLPKLITPLPSTIGSRRPIACSMFTRLSAGCFAKSLLLFNKTPNTVTFAWRKEFDVLSQSDWKASRFFGLSCTGFAPGAPVDRSNPPSVSQISAWQALLFFL